MILQLHTQLGGDDVVCAISTRGGGNRLLRVLLM